MRSGQKWFSLNQIQKLQTKIKRNKKNLNSVNFKESLSSIVHDCRDLIEMLSYMNSCSD